MKHMSLQEITQACHGTYHGPASLLTREISAVTMDSRQVEPECLFLAVQGNRADGHNFIPQVIQNGALCAIAEKELPNADFAYIQVTSSLQALRELAAYYRRTLSLPVVGISGSVGKTSAKEMIGSVLEEHYSVLKTEGNYNNAIGLPLTVLKIRPEHQVAVLEMGISDFGEMSLLAEIARPDICVITNIGCAHLEQLQSRDGILKAKTEMLAYMNPKGTILFNGDDDKLSAFSPENGIQPLYFGLGANCQFTATNIVDKGLLGTEATISTLKTTFPVHIPVPGRHMVLNALAAAAVGETLGLSENEIKAGIEKLHALPGRNRIFQTETFTLIDDCYNANPVSMKAALDVLSSAKSRRVAILGDMLELGAKSKELHRDIGRYVIQKKIDVLICIGSLATYIAEGAQTLSNTPLTTHTFPTTKDFLQAPLGEILHANDTILLKASHGMEFQKIVKRLQEMA